MRKELQLILNKDYWLYGLNERDFDFTIRLTNDIIKAIKSNYKVIEKKVYATKPNLAEEILDDISYYTHLDTIFVLHFCLWRLQAVFEGILYFTFIKPFYDKNLVGLNSKLKKARSLGYTLSDAEIDELLSWGNLRNILSHAPPEEFRPINLTKKDVLEYKKLILKFCRRWFKQKNNLI